MVTVFSERCPKLLERQHPPKKTQAIGRSAKADQLMPSDKYQASISVLLADKRAPIGVRYQSNNNKNKARQARTITTQAAGSNTFHSRQAIAVAYLFVFIYIYLFAIYS